MKKVVVTIWLILILAGIAKIFWYTDWKYSLPTPMPKNYHAVDIGSLVDMQGRLPVVPGKPLFIHFFNPSCPCSRFNIPHFNTLVRRYSDKINFAIVVMDPEQQYTVDEIHDKFDLSLPVSFDTTLAASCGVYSTPQAVLLDARQHLYYRGNYNKSRYCVNKESNYAQMAIDSLLHHTRQPVFGQYALQAYGCELPSCTKQ